MIDSSLRIIEIGSPPEPRPEAARLSLRPSDKKLHDSPRAVVQGI